ncbi:hypothetical protein SRABI128_06384 [Microbacterium sp. Bi128]|nr:hypothetical protein SRABI128_06384 [Microbacterium sp. Bi128]
MPSSADAALDGAPQAAAPDPDSGKVSEAGDSDAGAAVPAGTDTSTQSIAVVQPGSGDNTSTAAITVVDSASR